MTPAELAQAMGAGALAGPLALACQEFNVSKPLELAHLMGQLSVESNGFTATRESLNYSPDGLIKTFGVSRIGGFDVANRLGRTSKHAAQQTEIANRVYGGIWGRKKLGNTQPNDGWWFRGNGPTQITGRDNHLACSLALFGDQRLMTDPGILSRDINAAARSALWFWRWKKCAEYALIDNVVMVTKRINGGDNGLTERAGRTLRAKRLLGIAK